MCDAMLTVGASVPEVDTADKVEAHSATIQELIKLQLPRIVVWSDLLMSAIQQSQKVGYLCRRMAWAVQTPGHALRRRYSQHDFGRESAQCLYLLSVHSLQTDRHYVSCIHCLCYLCGAYLSQVPSEARGVMEYRRATMLQPPQEDDKATGTV